MTMQHLFICATCRRDVVDYAGRKGPDRQLAPICRYCQSDLGETAPVAGSFMDRRKAVQISALANALSGEAYRQQWKVQYGRA